jgi:hypothetical protein
VIVGQLHQGERGELAVDLGQAESRYGYRQRIIVSVSRPANRRASET